MEDNQQFKRKKRSAILHLSQEASKDIDEKELESYSMYLQNNVII